MKTRNTFLLFFFSVLLSCSPIDPVSEMIPNQKTLQVQKARNAVPQVVDHTQIKDPTAIKFDENKSLVCTSGVDLFRLTYFDAQSNAFWQCYDKKELVTALKNAGVPLADAVQRAHTIFHTANTSGQYLGETAGIIGPHEVVSPGIAYTGSIFYFLDNGACLEGCIPSGNTPGQQPVPIPGPSEENCPQGEIEAAAFMYGVSGNLYSSSPNNTNIVLRSDCDPNFLLEESFAVTEVRDVLTDAQWTDLVLGQYTEREFFDLFQQHVVRPLFQNHPDVDIDNPCYVMVTARFLTNYLYNGTFGRTNSYVRGQARISCDELPPVSD